MTSTKEDIKNRVKNRIPDLPEDLSDTMIKEWIDDAKVEIEEYTGVNIDINSIEDKYRGVLTNLTCLYLLCYKLGGGADSTGLSANLNLGEGVGVDYGSRGIQGFTEREVKQIDFFKNRVNQFLKEYGRSINYGFSDPGQRI